MGFGRFLFLSSRPNSPEYDVHIFAIQFVMCGQRHLFDKLRSQLHADRQHTDMHLLNYFIVMVSTRLHLTAINQSVQVSTVGTELKCGYIMLYYWA